MSIPIYGAQAHGGKIVQLDDQAVIKDLTALDGTGGNAYDAYAVSVPFAPTGIGTYSRLRRIAQRVPHDGSVTVEVRPYRDGQDTGQTISRDLDPEDNPLLEMPFDATGENFQIRVDVSDFDAPASLGAGHYVAAPKRSAR